MGKKIRFRNLVRPPRRNRLVSPDFCENCCSPGREQIVLVFFYFYLFFLLWLTAVNSPNSAAGRGNCSVSWWAPRRCCHDAAECAFWGRHLRLTLLLHRGFELDIKNFLSTPAGRSGAQVIPLPAGALARAPRWQEISENIFFCLLSSLQIQVLD